MFSEWYSRWLFRQHQVRLSYLGIKHTHHFPLYEAENTAKGPIFPFGISKTCSNLSTVVSIDTMTSFFSLTSARSETAYGNEQGYQYAAAIPVYHTEKSKCQSLPVYWSCRIALMMQPKSPTGTPSSREKNVCNITGHSIFFPPALGSKSTGVIGIYCL